MPFPGTKAKLKEAGYNFLAVKTCICGTKIELWQTPKDQVMPMNAMNDDDAPAVSHFGTCPNAKQFRRNKK